MPSGDSLSVTLFFISLAAAFYIQTLRPEIRKVRMRMLSVAVIILLIGVAWPFLGVLSPTFAASGFAVSLVSFASSPLTWFILLMVSLIASSLIPAVERWRAHRLPLLPVGLEPPSSVASFSVAPQDELNREKIVVLFYSSVDQAGGKLQEVMNEMFERLINQTKDEKGKQDEKILVVAQLAHSSVYISWMNAFSAFRQAVEGPKKADLQTLQQLLEEFFKSYQLLVRWMHRLSKFSPRVLHDGNLYTLWKDYHRVFRERLNALLVPEDFKELRENLKGHWNDTF